MVADLNKLAREIVEKNQYMTIGSANKAGEVWASVVAYVYDENYNFYFVSMPNSKHCSNFKENSEVVIAIFDSHQAWGEGIGLQIEGEILELKLIEAPKAIRAYYKRNYPYGKITDAFGKGLKNLLNKNLYKLYKFMPIKFWMNNPNSDIDERVEIKLL
ncbi:MAG: pyridoxamine 5'-phosphate oxidase family protein [Candidatus Levyibacteriota bacterium]